MEQIELFMKVAPVYDMKYWSIWRIFKYKSIMSNKFSLNILYYKSGADDLLL